MEIEIRNLCKSYGSIAAVDNVSLTVENGEFLSLLGPSGCGKTTLLRMVAGLIPVGGGQIFFNGKDVAGVPAQKRNTAMVFQNYALFPNLSVAENVAFGLKVRHLSKTERLKKVEHILKSVELDGMGNRRIQELSGGQRQRVALARALVIQPNILLFDEPLSNLDQKLRVSMRRMIKNLQSEFDISSIYVTHDQEEAMAISDRIAVMSNGKLLQIDTPLQLYRKPRNRLVADFIGESNLFNLKVEGQHPSRWVPLLNRRIEVPGLRSHKEVISLLLRPESLYFSDSGIPVTVVYHENLGLINRYQVKAAEELLLIDVVGQNGELFYKPGDKLYVGFNTESICFLD